MSRNENPLSPRSTIPARTSSATPPEKQIPSNKHFIGNPWFGVGLALLGVALSSCSTQETLPRVQVLPNSSGLEVASMNAHGPGWFSGLPFDSHGKLNPPTFPSGVYLSLKPKQRLHNKEPRYFMAPPAGKTAWQVEAARKKSDG
jgi:hypothetical protein